MPVPYNMAHTHAPWEGKRGFRNRGFLIGDLGGSSSGIVVSSPRASAFFSIKGSIMDSSLLLLSKLHI